MKSLLSLLVGVWIIIGSITDHCDQHGCINRNVYWSGTGWSYDWKDAKQYPMGTEINYVIPNGQHCCYSEEPTRIDPETGEVLGPL